MPILKKIKCNKCEKEIKVLGNKKANQMEGLPHKGCGGKWKCMNKKSNSIEAEELDDTL